MCANTVKNKNVITEVVANGICCGCGICAGICPRQSLSMRFNEQGEYNPYPTGYSCVQCGLCLRTCPFSDQEDNEDTLGQKYFETLPGIQHTKETGYFLEAHVGYSKLNGHRINGASGGLATWLLEMLLNSGEVDSVICVRSRTGGHPLFEFAVCDNADEVRKCGRSSYYPVEISGIIREILSSSKRYAVIGLPCLCKGLRLASQNMPALSRRIKYVLGLVCGQTKSRFFAESICAMKGSSARGLHKVCFRVKDSARPASDYGFQYHNSEGGQEQTQGTVFWSEGMNRIWLDRYFTPLACDMCDDVFAECADVTFMDAWLPKYNGDWQGHSIMLLRETQLSQIVRNNSLSSCELGQIKIDEVIQSQRGVVDDKRNCIRLRIKMARHSGLKAPKKRRHLFFSSIKIGKQSLVAAQWNIARTSGQLWKDVGGDFALFMKKNKTGIKKIDAARRMIARMRYPNAVLKRLFRG